MNVPARRSFAALVALWGAWKEAVSFVACLFALPVPEHLAMQALFVVRGLSWAATALGLVRGASWARTAFLALWAFSAVVMSLWWMATDPMSSSALFSVVSTAAAWGMWRDRG